MVVVCLTSSPAAADVGSDKPVVLEFGTTQCQPCKMFDTQILTRREIVAALELVPIVHYDLDTPEGQGVAQRYNITAVPAFVVVAGPEGNELERVIGLPDPKVFVAMLVRAPERGKLARERFEAAQRWLPAETGDRYAIQLVTVSSEQLGLLEDFLLKASKILPMGEVYIYSVKINNQQHYRVAYGSYENQGEALEGIKNLPPSLAVYRPYTRSVERMRSQNRQ